MEAITKKAKIAYTPTTIEGGIASWTKSLGSAPTLISYLNQGNCFVISRSDFDKWNTKTPERLHVYPAVFDGVMKFVVTDNVTDGDPKIDFTSVFVKDYTFGSPLVVGPSDLPGDPIPVTEGLERVFRWQMTYPSWVTARVGFKGGMFQAFSIPYSDLQDLFSDDSVTHLFGVFGLRPTGVSDIILWNNLTFAPATLADMAVPVPPFSAYPVSYFQLLVQS